MLPHLVTIQSCLSVILSQTLTNHHTHRTKFTSQFIICSSLYIFESFCINNSYHIESSFIQPNKHPSTFLFSLAVFSNKKTWCGMLMIFTAELSSQQVNSDSFVSSWWKWGESKRKREEYLFKKEMVGWFRCRL